MNHKKSIEKIYATNKPSKDIKGNKSNHE